MLRYIREPFNGISHFVGALLAAGGLVWFLYSAHANGRMEPVWPLVVFGGTMVLLFLSSTVYHSLHASVRVLGHLRRMDHIMIYVFIAGTYTPVCVLLVGGATGRTLLIAIWTVALFGTLKKVFWLDAPRIVSVASYVAMGWLGVFVLPQFIESVSTSGLAWFVGGGVSYSVGALVYALRWPNLAALGFHELWHLFVMAGTFSHYWTIHTYLTTG